MRRGYLKIHIAVDVKQKKILALEVTDEKVGECSSRWLKKPQGRVRSPRR